MELIGLLLPLFIKTINKRVSDSDLRFWISVIVCAVVGLFLSYIETSFMFESLQDAFNSVTATIMIVFGLSQVSYRGVFADDSTVKKIL